MGSARRIKTNKKRQLENRISLPGRRKPARFCFSRHRRAITAGRRRPGHVEISRRKPFRKRKFQVGYQLGDRLKAGVKFFILKLKKMIER